MDPAVHLVRSTGLSDVAEYAYASTVAPGARLVFPAGACPLDDTGATVAPGDVAQHREEPRHLCHRLDDENARHHRVRRKMPLEERLVHRDVLQAADESS